MNTPEELIKLAKANFPHPILLLTSSDNGRLFSLSESTQPMPFAYHPRNRGMKFRGPGWEIHLQEVDSDVINLHYDYDCYYRLDGSLIATWDVTDGSLRRQETPNP